MSGNSIQRIFLDISHTFRSGENTGIQRVVRKLGEYLPRLAENGDLVCQPILFDRGRFWTIPNSDTSIPFCSREKSLEQFTKSAPNFLVPRSSTANRPTADSFDARPPSGTTSKVWRGPFDVYWKWQRFRSKFQFSEPVEFCSSDILLLPDGYWSLNEIWPAVEEAKQTGAWVTCLVYDIICLTHPHFFPEKPVTAFRNYLQEVQQKADLILTISHTVRQQLETYRHAEMADCAHPEIRVFRLGADRLEIQGIVRPELEIAFQSAVQPYVMVATLEPRKNHHFVLDAFESLWHRGGDQKLVLAGKVGWSCDALLSRLQRHPELGRKIFVFHDLSDREIGYCYQHSSGAISASVTEGFGLPIVEALQYGKPVFASDIDVHREAGGQSCHYFSLRSADCLADMVTNFENRREHRAQSTAVDENTSWEASTTEFLQIVVEQWAVDHLKDGDSHVAQRLPHGAGRKSIEQCDSPRDRKLAKVSTRR